MLKKHNLIIFLLVLGILPGVASLFHPGFFPTDDGSWMVIRFSAFYEALRHGQFPVRFLPRLYSGYGYPVADFLYPGFMYLGVPIHVVGFSFVNTIKIIFGGSLICSGIFTYLWLRKFFRVVSAFVGGLVYALFPYQLYDVYKRGSVGEVLAMSVVPFIFWQIERKGLVWSGIGIGFLIIAHNTLALLFLPVLIVYMILRKRAFAWIGKSILLGLGLSSFFWGPALNDKQFTVFDSTSIAVSSQYFLGPQYIGLFGGTSLVAILLSGVLCFRQRSSLVTYFLGIVFLGSFFALPLSLIFWKLLPLGLFVQFPFRFLSIVAVGVGYIFAVFIDSVPKKLRIFVITIAIILIYISAWGFLAPKQFQNYPDTFYSTNQDTTTVKNEYMPKWVKRVPENVTGKIAADGIVLNITDTGSNILFTVDSRSASTVRINTVYFPGWEASVDGKKTVITHDNPYGFIEVQIEQGKHIVKISFRETPVRLLYDTISFLSIVMLLLMSMKNSLGVFLLSKFGIK